MQIHGIIDVAIDNYEKQKRVADYQHDPVLWAKDILGLQVWGKQRETMYSVRDNYGTAIAAGHGVGKDLPLDTLLPTPTGWTTMGDVRPGEYVLDQAGRPTRVVTKSQIFNHRLFKMGFSDGTDVVSSGTHMWNVIPFLTAKQIRRKAGGRVDWRDHWDASITMQTSELMAAGLKRKNGKGLASKFMIPINSALELPEADLPVDPYILGAWLGDGSSGSAEMTIGNDGKYIVDEFSKKGVTLKQGKSSPLGYHYAFTWQGFVGRFRELGVFKNKHIPMAYLRSSIDQRKELLRGIMDTDGFSIHGAQVGVDFANEKLAHGLAELVRSLGIKCNVRANAMYMGSEIVGTRYRMAFTPQFDVFTEGSYKSEAWTRSDDSMSTARWIVSIEEVESVPSQCISVDSDRSLYLATENMIVTHNTFIAAIICAWWADIHWNDDCFIATTAPTFDQVNILWDYIRKMYALAETRLDEGLIDHKLPGYITSDNQWKLDNGERIGQGRKPPDSRSDVAFQGRHAKWLLAVGDEAVGIPEGFLDALGNIATGPENRQLLLANPTDPHCAMAKLWDNTPDGWNLMHISILDAPTITPDPLFNSTAVTGMSGWEYVNRRREEWGEDDPRYIARVLGQWAFDSADLVFTDEDLANGANCVVIPDDLAIVRFGIDVARSPKGDFTVVYRVQDGQVWERQENEDGTIGKLVATGRRGEHLRLVDKWRGAPLTGSNPENLGSDYRIDGLALEWGAAALIIDVAGGYGIGVKDGLTEIDNSQYVMVDAWGSDTSSVDRRQFVNARAFNYFELKRKLHMKLLDIAPDDETLIEELRGIQYEHDSAARVKIEAKDDIRRRGGKSPDFADAAWYACMNIDHILLPSGDGNIVGYDMDEAASEFAGFYDELQSFGW
jgi:hypothetical protein